MRELLSTNKKLTLLFSSGLCSEQPCNKHRDDSCSQPDDKLILANIQGVRGILDTGKCYKILIIHFSSTTKLSMCSRGQAVEMFSFLNRSPFIFLQL